MSERSIPVEVNIYYLFTFMVCSGFTIALTLAVVVTGSFDILRVVQPRSWLIVVISFVVHRYAHYVRHQLGAAK